MAVSHDRKLYEGNQSQEPRQGTCYGVQDYVLGFYSVQNSWLVNGNVNGIVFVKDEGRICCEISRTKADREEDDEAKVPWSMPDLEFKLSSLKILNFVSRCFFLPQTKNKLINPYQIVQDVNYSIKKIRYKFLKIVT